MLGRGPDRVMIGRTGLHEDPAAARAAPRAARHLRHQLKRALASSKVGKMQPRVGIHYAYDRNIGEVEPLGDHLSAEQHVHLATGDTLENVMVRPLAGG